MRKNEEFLKSINSAPTFVGRKTSKSIPMTRKEYNDFRGWVLPEDEEGADPGYMVMDVGDHGIKNVQGAEGYISWSSLDVFEESYVLAETPLDRLHIEKGELKAKFDAAESFMTSNTPIPAYAAALLTQQVSTMHTYLQILEARIMHMQDMQKSTPTSPLDNNPKDEKVLKLDL